MNAPDADILREIIELLKARVATGAATFLIKVKAHRGEPLRVEEKGTRRSVWTGGVRKAVTLIRKVAAPVATLAFRSSMISLKMPASGAFTIVCLGPSPVHFWTALSSAAKSWLSHKYTSHW